MVNREVGLTLLDSPQPDPTPLDPAPLEPPAQGPPMLDPTTLPLMAKANGIEKGIVKGIVKGIDKGIDKGQPTWTLDEKPCTSV